MARLFNGTNDSIEGASAPVTSYPLTIACWVNPSVLTAGVLISVGISGGSDRFQIYIDSANSKRVATLISASGSTVETYVSGTYSTGSWFHAASVFTSSSARSAYYNGILGTGGFPSGTPLTPSGLNRINIGARYNTTLGGYASGSIAEVGVWNVALTADEIASLAKGFPCRLVRPSALQFYSRLVRNVQDLRGGVALSELGTGTTVSDHPRIIYP